MDAYVTIKVPTSDVSFLTSYDNTPFEELTDEQKTSFDRIERYYGRTVIYKIWKGEYARC